MLQPDYLGKVRVSPDLERILALARRLEPISGGDELEDVLKLPDGQMQLRPVQQRALVELFYARGLVGPIRVGAGKTLITFLAPTVLESRRPVLLVPAKLRDKTFWDFSELRKHWVAPPPIEVVSYELLGRKQHAEWLESYQPDLIMADEAHYLSSCTSAVSKRVARYLDGHRQTTFIALSGTITKRKLMDFAHMMEWALHEGAPLPLNYLDLEEWSRVVDEESVWEARMHPGALMALVGPPEEDLVGVEQVRRAVQRRMVETVGVVSTPETAVDVGLELHPWGSGIQLGESVDEAQEVLYKSWERPDGVYLTSALEVWRHARELWLGFWYKWEPEPPEAWLEARKLWGAFVRSKLAYHHTLDSSSQVEDRFRDSAEWKAWEAIKDDYRPNLSPKWLSYAVLEEVCVWAQEHESDGGIIWVEHRAVGEELEQLFHLPYYRSKGLNSDGEPIEKAKGVVVASIAANKEGRNLQHFHDNLVLSPPTTGAAWEQLLGRTHREGQKADVVVADVYCRGEENLKAVWSGIFDARYQNQITNNPQKLLEATIAIPMLT